MKKEREIAELVFDVFRENGCQEGQDVLFNDLVPFKYELNPKEQNIWDEVCCGLMCLGFYYLNPNKTGLRLTKKGLDYIYDDELIERTKSLPWIIPDFKKTDWDLAYNCLWNIIGPTNEAPFYIGGPDFLALAKKVDNSISSSYYQYINDLNKNGKSTSRVNYYREIIMSLDNNKRFQMFVEIQKSIEGIGSESTEMKETTILNDINMLYTSLVEAAKNIKEMNGQIQSNKKGYSTTTYTQIFPLGNKRRINVENDNNKSNLMNISETKNLHVDRNDKEIKKNPVVFISYSWDGDEHQDWVRLFAERLVSVGIDVKLDQWELRGGDLMANFMQEAVNNAQRVLCIITPNYYIKAQGLKGGVGCEYSIISTKIANNLHTDRFIPILRAGNDIPTYLDGRYRFDFTNEDRFEDEFKNLIREIYNEPKYKKPALGSKPDFNNF